MDSQEIQIVTGEEVKQQISPEELEQLADLFLEEMVEPVEVPITQTRNAVEKVLAVVPSVRKLVSLLMPHFETYAEIQEENKMRHRSSLLKDLNKALRRGDLVIARRADEIVGMVRVTKIPSIGANPYIQEGGEVYEIGKSLIVPKERGKKVYKELRQQALNHILQRYGEVPVLICTKNPAIKHLEEEAGAQEIGMEAYYRIWRRPVNGTQEALRKDEVDRYTAFLYTPKKQSE